jgi:hypothetical protein
VISITELISHLPGAEFFFQNVINVEVLVYEFTNIFGNLKGGNNL